MSSVLAFIDSQADCDDDQGDMVDVTTKSVVIAWCRSDNESSTAPVFPILPDLGKDNFLDGSGQKGNIYPFGHVPSLPYRYEKFYRLLRDLGGRSRPPQTPPGTMFLYPVPPCPAGPHPRRGGAPPDLSPGGAPPPHASLPPINSKVSLEWNGVRMAWMTVHLVSGNPFIEGAAPESLFREWVT